jgi:hypothetical protein
MTEGDIIRAMPASFLGERSTLKIILEVLRVTLARSKIRKN